MKIILSIAFTLAAATTGALFTPAPAVTGAATAGSSAQRTACMACTQDAGQATAADQNDTGVFIDT